MRRKKIIVILIIVFLVIALGVVYYFIREDKNTLTVSEKKWIENNKNNLIDLSLPSDTPILSFSGDGVIFDFLEDLEEDTSLEFNKQSYKNGSDINTNYSFTTTDTVGDNDILIYSDFYSLVTKSKSNYVDISQINNIVVGVLEENLTKTSKYLSGSGDINYKSYKTTEEMINAIETEEIDGIVLPRIQYINQIVSNDKLNIAYNITDYKINYVLKLGDNTTLNKILTKYYKKWSNENFIDSFNKSLVTTYFDAKETKDSATAKLTGKKYSYGFVENSPFDLVTNGSLRGFNYNVLNDFAKATDIDIEYKKYSNIQSLLNDFESNKLDIIFNYQSKDKYNMDVYETASTLEQKIAIASIDNNISIDNVNSLANQTVKTIKDSKIDKYLTDSGVKTKTYNNCKDLLNHLNNNDLLAIDFYTYDYYVRDSLEDYTLLGILNTLEDYNFINRDISANKTFNELFDFYLSFEDKNQILNRSNMELLKYNSATKILKGLLFLFIILLVGLIIIIFKKTFKGKKVKHKRLTKTDKLRYIDTLTSLKNRNYLNDNIMNWDASDTYPRAIIIIDLNNVAYINDNFGHSEGDKLIVEGASILINNQLSNSELIRTDGNEFLIFMMGHDEKEIITYIRKLHKEFKNISHGFGAEIGYSVILDDIKTIDDAINEATIDMKNNKENK